MQRKGNRLVLAKRTSPSRLRAGVIGCGAIAESCHIPGYLNHPAVGEVILCDPNEKILREAQQKFQISKGYSDYKEMLKKEDLDLVSICTPNHLHAEMVCAAAQKDIHVLCEKPMALTLADAERIRRALAGRRVKFMVAFSHRFAEINNQAKEMLAAGKIGQPFMIRVRFGHEGPYPRWGKTDWFYDKAKAGFGALMDMGIHAIDLARFFLGNIESVVARMVTLLKPIKLDDNALLIVQFESRALGYLDVSWTSKPGFTGSEIYGSGGTLIVDYDRGLQFFDGEKAQWQNVPLRGEPGIWERQMRYFVDCVVKDDDTEPGFLEGLAALRVALAAARSAKSGKVVKVETGAKKT